MIPRERTARTNGTIAHGSRFARQKRLEGQTARGRRLQPQSEAVISGHGRVCRSADSVRESGDPNLRTPRLAELANSCSHEGRVLDGRDRGPSDANCASGIRPDRAWPSSGRPACGRRVNVARRRPPVWAAYDGPAAALAAAAWASRSGRAGPARSTSGGRVQAR